MAGIGVKLNRIFEKPSLAAHIYGYGYSSAMTVAPMIVVIGSILVSQVLLGYSSVDYYRRELFADTVLYIFIFSLLSASPFNAVLSRYLSDIIFKEEYDSIMPCFYVGLIINVGFGCLFAIPFCIHEYLVGQVPMYYVFTGYCGFIALLLVFYTMLYLSITKDYVKITGCYTIGMALTVLFSLLFVRVLRLEMSYSILLALVIGFGVIASLEIALVQSYFRYNSGKYRDVLQYFKKYWKLVFINFLYTLGLYTHNFVFWTTDMHTILVRSFVTMMSYDMATCLAMFTNISASVIFITRIEMHFHTVYKNYSEAVIGGRGHDIRNAKRRMFRQLTDQVMGLARLQFIITVIAFLICTIFLPLFGFGGLTMRIYPCLCVGYFILFIMYSVMLFLYYFNDLTGALIDMILFFSVTLIGSIIATHLPDIWYGLGVVLGTFAGFSYGYYRLNWLEKNLDSHIFCRGTLMKKGNGVRPSGKVYDRKQGGLIPLDGQEADAS